MIKKAILQLDDHSIEIPIKTGVDNKQGLDISNLYDKAGVITIDPGFYNTGIGESSVSRRVPEGELYFRGYNVKELVANCSFVETAYLLIYGELPKPEEYKDFSAHLSKHSVIHEDMLNLFDGFPNQAHPLAVLSTMVMSLSSYYTSEYEVSLEKDVDHISLLLSKIRTLAAFSYKRMIGQPFVYPLTKLPFCTNFLYMLFSVPTQKYEVPSYYEKVINKLWILYAEHEQNAASTIVQLVGSTQANLFASISSGISALWGSREGGQNVAAVELIEEIIHSGQTTKSFLESIKNGKKELISNGFGHPAYNVRSPRSIVAKELFANFYQSHKIDKIAEIAFEIDEICSSDPFFIENRIYPNLEFYSGVIYNSMGIPKSFFTVMQVIGKLPGWMAHWRELRIKGVYNRPRPKQIYVGAMDKKIQKK
jgi:citrate synthase